MNAAFQFDFYVPLNEQERKLVAAFWYVKGKYPFGQQERILPSGHVEMIFNLSEPVSFFRNIDESRGSMPRCFIAGLSMNDVTLVKSNEHHYLGIQFHPIGLRAALGIPGNELVNSYVDYTLISKEIDVIWHRLVSEPYFHNQVRILLLWLRRQMSLRKHCADADMMDDLYRYVQGGNRSLGDLRNKYNLSERTLRRKSNEWLGVSMESFLRYHKYMRALQLLHAGSRSLTEIAYTCGYFDQSHFIREFRSFTSMSPSEYRKEKSAYQGHIYMPC